MSTEANLSQEVQMANTNEDADVDEEKNISTIPTAEFKEVVDELRSDPRFANDHKFKNAKLVNGTRRAFEFILVWFSVLLLVWDIAVPFGCIKTAFWKDEDIATCAGCTQNCIEFGTPGYNADCKPDDRPYGDTPLFFNPQFRQEFGVYWIVLISFHVFGAWIAFPSYIIQLFFTKRGRKFHKFCGIFILFVVMVLWSFGGVAAAILIFYRGFHPCAFVIENYNNPNSIFQGYRHNLSEESSASSFSFYLYLQFAYDGALLNECLMHGISARLLASMSFDPKYSYIEQTTMILHKWQANLLGLLFLCTSIVVHVFSALMIIGNGSILS